jgi:hypothetical protein
MKEWKEPTIWALGVEDTAEGTMHVSEITAAGLWSQKYVGNGDDKYLLDSEEDSTETPFPDGAGGTRTYSS